MFICASHSCNWQTTVKRDARLYFNAFVASEQSEPHCSWQSDIGNHAGACFIRTSQCWSTDSPPSMSTDHDSRGQSAVSLHKCGSAGNKQQWIFSSCHVFWFLMHAKWQVKCELWVAKVGVGIFRVEVRAEHASTQVKCVTGEYASHLLKDWRVQIESIISSLVDLPVNNHALPTFHLS